MNTRRLGMYQLLLSRTLVVLAGVCAVSIFLYGVFLLLAVEHTAARTALEKKNTEITLQLSGLETEYLAETKTLTQERAAGLGFVTPASVAAVFADNGLHPLSLKQ